MLKRSPVLRTYYTVHEIIRRLCVEWGYYQDGLDIYDIWRTGPCGTAPKSPASSSSFPKLIIFSHSTPHLHVNLCRPRSTWVHTDDISFSVWRWCGHMLVHMRMSMHVGENKVLTGLRKERLPCHASHCLKRSKWQEHATGKKRMWSHQNKSLLNLNK